MKSTPSNQQFIDTPTGITVNPGYVPDFGYVNPTGADIIAPANPNAPLTTAQLQDLVRFGKATGIDYIAQRRRLMGDKSIIPSDETPSQAWIRKLFTKPLAPTVTGNANAKAAGTTGTTNAADGTQAGSPVGLIVLAVAVFCLYKILKR